MSDTVEVDMRDVRVEVLDDLVSGTSASDMARPKTDAAAPAGLRRDFALNLVGNGSYAAAQWGLLVVLARLGSPSVVGEYAFALAIVAPLVMFANMRLNALLASDAKRGFALGDYVSARALTTLGAVLASLVVAAATDAGRAALVIVLLVAIGKAVETLSDLVQGYYWLHHDFARASASLLVRGVLMLAFTGVAMLVKPSAASAAAAIAIAFAAGFAIVDVPGFARHAARDGALGTAGSRRDAWAALVRPTARTMALVRTALPLGFVAMTISLNASVPRLVIVKQLGVRELGIFSALAYVVVGARMVMLALGSAALPRLGQRFAAGDRAGFLRLLAMLLAFGAGIGAVGVLIAAIAGAPILRLVYGAAYGEHPRLFVLLIAGGALGFLSTYLQDSLTTLRMLAPKAGLLFVVCAALALLSVTLVPRYGLDGAGWATLGGAVVELFGSASLVVWALRTRWDAAAPIAAAP